ncbi:YolD-like family protein [Bacillaceae bacterium S4-13-58]
MLRDRGTIKWTAMMLPEHVELLKEIWNEDDKPLRKTLDEQTQSEWDRLLQQAVKLKFPLEIEYIANQNIYKEIGIPTHLDPLNGTVRIKNLHQEETTISVSSIQNLVLARNP